MKKLLALFLALVLCFGMIPFGTVAMAEESPTDAVEIFDSTFKIEATSGSDTWAWQTVNFDTI